jgi:hypothetical protein
MGDRICQDIWNKGEAVKREKPIKAQKSRKTIEQLKKIKKMRRMWIVIDNKILLTETGSYFYGQKYILLQRIFFEKSLLQSKIIRNIPL